MNMRPYLAAVLVALMFALYANAGSIYSWSSGEVLQAGTLNSNFAHIHNTMVGGHGARLVDADVSGSASISRSKLANYQSIPVAWAAVNGTCSGSPCTVSDSFGVSGITRSGTGTYSVTMTTVGDTTYGVTVGVFTADVQCYVGSPTATTFSVTCRTIAGSPAAVDAAFAVAVYDNN